MSGSSKMSVALYTNCTDVGISMVAPYGTPINNVPATRDVSVIGSYSTGYGYNIIDPSAQLPPTKKCYNIKMNIVPAKCINKGKSNIGTYREEVEEADCDGTIVENATENGRLVYEGQGCKIHCLETAQQLFPGNIRDKIEIGRYLIWPTSEASAHNTYFKNDYPLQFVGTRTCKITGNAQNCQNVSSAELYPFETDAHISWDNGVNASKIQRLTSDDLKYTKTVSGDTITVTASKNYYLPENLNRYYSLEDNKPYNYEPSGPFIDVGTSTLPVSGKATEGFHNLEVINSKLGANNVFGLAASENKYVCNYEVVSDSPNGCTCPEDSMINAGLDIYDNIVKDNISCAEGIQKYCYMSCECPPGTKYSGKNLVGYLNDSTSCSQAQQLYCENDDNVCVTCGAGTVHEGMYLMTEEACSKPILTEADLCDNEVNENKYCPEPYDTTKNISACINAGMSYNECVQKLCPSPDDEYKCKNTNQVGGEMDITSCVYTKVGQGLSLDQAISACDKLICPLPAGLRIIYRVIDLTNPFPSYDADSSFPNNLPRGKFNRTVRGRYPGANWNSETVVKTKILENRGEDGDKVYKKEPLYVIKLTTKEIKAIRSYNRGTNYLDFNLDCKINNSLACVSSFLKEPIAGLQGGVCKDANKTNFYSCVNRGGINR